MHSCQVIVLGPSRAGKTTLLEQFANGEPHKPSHLTSRVAVARQRQVRDGRVCMWDVPAAVAYPGHSETLQRVLDCAQACVFLFDMSSRASFELLADYIRLRSRLNPNCGCCIVVGNKCDLTRVEVPEREAAAYAQTRGMLHATISAKHNWGVPALLETILELTSGHRLLDATNRRCCSCAIL